LCHSETHAVAFNHQTTTLAVAPWYVQIRTGHFLNCSYEHPLTPFNFITEALHTISRIA
jgi:hypothetical protein